MNLYIYLGSAFLGGFLIAWVIRSITVAGMKKELKSRQGLLESERLMKENAQKESSFLIQSSDASLQKMQEKIKAAEQMIKMMDSDILLLQKSNEETEALLKAGEPALHEMKMKLIEAQNNLARIKGGLAVK